MSGSPAPAITNVSTHLPAEWRGRARLLRDRISEAHSVWFQASELLLAPLRPRVDFTPQFTQETLRITAARYSRLPEWGRLRIASKLRNRANLQIVETRLCPFRVVMADWDGTELSVAVTLTVLDIRLPAFYSRRTQVLAAIGLHALGRRFERGSDRSDGSVLRDLFNIGSTWPEAIRSPTFEIASTGGGRWVGAVKSYQGKATLAIRTFMV